MQDAQDTIKKLVVRYGVSHVLRMVADSVGDLSKALDPKVRAKIGYAREAQASLRKAKSDIQTAVRKIKNRE